MGHHCLINDSHASGSWSVLCADGAPQHNRNTRDIEVTGANLIFICISSLALVGDEPRYNDLVICLRSAKNPVTGIGNPVHSRNCRQPLGQMAGKLLKALTAVAD